MKWLWKCRHPNVLDKVQAISWSDIKRVAFCNYHDMTSMNHMYISRVVTLCTMHSSRKYIVFVSTMFAIFISYTLLSCHTCNTRRQWWLRAELVSCSQWPYCQIPLLAILPTIQYADTPYTNHAFLMKDNNMVISYFDLFHAFTFELFR